MGVNLSAITRYYVRGASQGVRSVLFNLLPPLLGFVVCFYLWYSLRTPAKIAGFVWLALGVIYRLAWRPATR